MNEGNGNDSGANASRDKSNGNPLKSVEEWDDYVQDRYRPDRQRNEFRDYEDTTDGVREFYRLNHEQQTFDFVKKQHETYLPLRHEKVPMWDVLLRLNELVDDSDPDTDLPQIVHALQTAEKIREDGHPDWFSLIGLIHDSGKMLCFYNEPQWAVVGDTFPVGCDWSEKIVFSDFFKNNPDAGVDEYQTELGVYEKNCGLDNVMLSWGHDEYIYQVMKDSKIPEEGLYMLRYHSFYPWHREGSYRHLMNEKDHQMLPWVKKFSGYDLYSKSDTVPKAEEVRPYYQGLIDKYLPATLNW
ncbi:MAG: inositol oxygenase family protein [Bryobacterales bacterium]